MSTCSFAGLLRQLQLAFPGYAGSRYAAAFEALEITDDGGRPPQDEALQRVRVGLDSIRGLFPGNVTFQKTFREADALLNTLVEIHD